MRASRIQELSDSGNKRAQLVLKMLENMDGYLSTVQLGITLMSLALGFVAEPALARFLIDNAPLSFELSPVMAHSLSLAISFFIVSYFHIVLGELVPRGIALRNAEKLILIFGPILMLVQNFFRPLLFIFDKSAKLILILFGMKTNLKSGDKVSEEEIRLMLIESITKGTMTDAKLDLIDNVFDFSKRTARQVMLARDNIVSLDISKPVEENLHTVRHSGHTRYPLCEGAVDQVIGLVNVKDFLFQNDAQRGHMDLRKIRRDILFVPESKPLTRLLRDFQKNKIHMAIVIDEFGLTVGLVTLEDVLEELVGEIQDEFDQEVQKIQILRDGTFLIEGIALIEEVEEKLGVKIERKENATIGGAVLSKLGRLPKVTDSVEFDGFTFKVRALKGRRIYSLHAFRKKGI